ncbi:peptidase S41 family protein [Byssothecium circinans]|uniref:Peptidase S41 family protein n=1 Tax=Byssothecium circinans TaxID=147558 RepID=A0A6A5U9L1_9PLEO|nr:peptidase S41 family protein [Byssothecium circinans]
MKVPALLALTRLATLVSATPVAPALPRPLPQIHPLRARQDNGTNSTAPCAQVSQAIYSHEWPPYQTHIPAKIAYDCITSVPLNVSSAKTLLSEIPELLEWQSTLKALADPPAEYVEKVQPAVDLLGGLQTIAAQIDDGKIATEYDFGWTLYTLLQSAHDGHLYFVPDSVGNIFTWGRTVPLVSVSDDGSQLPAVFAFADVLGMQFKNISYTPSPVVEIDGVGATEFLEGTSQYGSLQDRDALYNNMFYGLAQIALGGEGSVTGAFTGGGRGRYVYPGPTTTLKFANGTTHVMENYANVLTSFRNIENGEQLAAKNFYYGSVDATSAMTEAEAAAAAPAAATTPATPGYPSPVDSGAAGAIKGYYIQGSGYEDVAVLQLLDFVSVDQYEEDFQATSKRFFAKAAADGKTKLILDVQANGGGTILQGYDLFKQLFPSIDPYGANRFRYSEAVDLIGQSISSFASSAPRGSTSNTTILSAQATWFDYHNDMTVDGKPFTSWNEKVGPVEVNGDKYTTLARWNLSDVLIERSAGINITGYGPLANVTGPPKFKPENIVLLSDGYCASTCTIFSEFLTKQAGVKTIALGGRSNRNQIQAIGGVKGVNNYGWSYLTSQAALAIRVAPPALQAKLNATKLATTYRTSSLFSRTATPPGVNVRDGLALNDTSGVALQFKYEEADCRLYYTPEMTIDASATWKAAADAQWGSSGKCVGKSGYGGDGKGESEVAVATAKLNTGRVKVSHAVALQKYEEFERSFSLETISKKQRTGYMLP